jgi:hypothetical protein
VGWVSPKDKRRSDPRSCGFILTFLAVFLYPSILLYIALVGLWRLDSGFGFGIVCFFSVDTSSTSCNMRIGMLVVL